MNAIESYERMIELIEDMIAEENSGLTDIVARLSQSEGIPAHKIGTIFTFITGQTLSEYTKERQMDCALEIMLSDDEFSCDYPIEITGFNDQSAFIKAFKRIYGITPKKAFDEHRTDLLKGPLTWDELMNRCEEGRIETDGEKYMKENQIFGIREDQYRLIENINSLKEVYGFSTKEANEAFKLSQACDVDIERAFSKLDDLRVQLRSDHLYADEGDELLPGYVEKIYTELKLCFQHGLSYDEARDMKEEFECSGYDISSFPEEMTGAFTRLKDPVSVPDFIRYYEFYEDRKESLSQYYGPVEDFMSLAHYNELDGTSLEDMAGEAEENERWMERSIDQVQQAVSSGRGFEENIEAVLDMMAYERGDEM